MKINIHGKNLKLTPAIKSYVEEKIGRLDKFLEDSESVVANVNVRTSGKEQIIEVTMPIKKIILRGEERHEDLYAAIDLVSEKIERQIRKNKTRMQKRQDQDYLREFKMANIETEETEEKVVKRKKLEMKPMDEEEAILQMNLLGHDFFVYYDYNEEAVCVLYCRKDGNYGLIVTK